MLDLVNIDTNLLLCGDVHLPLQTINIFSVAYKFIGDSTRFTEICSLHILFLNCYIIQIVFVFKKGPVSCLNLFLIILNCLKKQCPKQKQHLVYKNTFLYLHWSFWSVYMYMNDPPIQKSFIYTNSKKLNQMYWHRQFNTLIHWSNVCNTHQFCDTGRLICDTLIVYISATICVVLFQSWLERSNSPRKRKVGCSKTGRDSSTTKRHKVWVSRVLGDDHC